MRQQQLVTVSMISLLFFLGAGCKPEAEPTPQPVPQTTPAPSVNSADSAAITPTEPAPTPTLAPTPTPTPSVNAKPTPVTINVTAEKFAFVPSTITVKKDQQVTLNITSSDVDHGLAISAFNVKKMVKAGTTESVTFTPDKTGSFSMYCNVFCGDGHGSMKGTLIVE